MRMSIYTLEIYNLKMLKVVSKNAIVRILCIFTYKDWFWKAQKKRTNANETYTVHLSFENGNKQNTHLTFLSAQKRIHFKP